MQSYEKGTEPIPAWKHWLGPPVFEDEEKTRLAAVLQIILLIMITVSLLTAVTLLILHDEFSPPLIISSTLLLLQVGAWLLMRTGQVRLTAILLTALLWLALTAVTLFVGGIQSPSYAAYMVIIILAGLLLGEYAGFALAGLSALVGLGILYVQTQGLLPPYNTTLPTTWLAQTANFIVVAGLLFVASRSIKKALAQTQRKEQSLGQLVADLRATTVSGNYFDNIINTMADALIVLTPDATIEMVNQATLNLLGYTQAELVGQPINRVWTEAESQWIDIIKIHAGPVTRLETIYWAKDGHQIPVTFSCSIMYRPDGQIEGIVCLAQDITARKQAEDTRRESEHFIRRIATATPHVIYVYDIIAQRSLYLNRPVAEPLGYSPAQIEALGPGFPLQLIHPDDLIQMNELLERWNTAADSDIIETEYRIRHADGGWRWYVESDVVFLRTDQGRVQQIIGVAQDITARKQVEGALRQSEAGYRSLFEDSPISLWEQDFSTVKAYLEVLRNQGINDFEAYLTDKPEEVTHCATLVKIINMNKAALEVYQASHKDELGQNLVQFFNQQSYEAFKAVLVAIAQNQTELEQETVNLTLTGEKKNITLRWFVAPGSEETYAKVLVSIIDITERKRLEAQLRQAHKIEAIGRLAGGIAHDFNNILTIIRGYTGLLLLTVAENEPIYQDIRRIDHAAERASGLTRQLLAFSRQQILQPQVLSLNDIMAKMEDMLQRFIGEDIHLITRLGAEQDFIKADAGQIEQIIINLVVNARDAMPNGGLLTLETTNVELDETYARQHVGVRVGPYVRLTVNDTGHGMDTETQAHLFEPFFTTKEVGQGTGLGLAMVHGIINQSEGHIWVDSQLNQGTTFKIYLPQVPETKPVPLPPEESPAAIRRCSETVLVVEDEEEVRELISFFLENEGYTVLTAGQGDEALKVFEAHPKPIDLLLTDVIMPGGMSGRQLGERLAELQPGLKILYISGYTDDTMVRYGVRQNDLALLQKPFTLNQLFDKVRQTLDTPLEIRFDSAETGQPVL